MQTQKPDDTVEVLTIMSAFGREVFDAVWTAIEPLVPAPVDHHPKGGHRPRIPDRLCFRGILVRLLTGCSWVDVEALLDWEVSDTTLRARRDEWIAAGVFDALVAEALDAYDRVIGLDFGDVALDASQQKAPAGGEGTGPNPTDKRKLGWKWSLVTDRAGIPVGWATDGANRHDVMLTEATLDAAGARGLLEEMETLHLDRAYVGERVRSLCAERGITDLVVPKKNRPGRGRRKVLPWGLRWPVERTNSWLTNFGQLRRNTDRSVAHRLAELALAIALILTVKLIDWRDRWSL